MNSFHYVRLPRTLNPILRGVVIKKRVVIVETFRENFPNVLPRVLLFSLFGYLLTAIQTEPNVGQPSFILPIS